MFAEVSPIPLKYALSLMGISKNELRLPLSTTGREKEIREVLSKNNII
jgi:dihydrodipicolinate synthase/N-acetylneuraminate lyase